MVSSVQGSAAFVLNTYSSPATRRNDSESVRVRSVRSIPRRREPRDWSEY